MAELAMDVKEPLLDDLDQAIIEILIADGRAPFSQIAKELGVSANTVRNRLKSLLEQDVIEISAYPNPNRGPSRLRVQLAFRVEASQYDSVARRLAECPVVHYLALTTGRFDLVAVATFTDRQELLRFITDIVSGTPGIVAMESSVILEVAKSRGRVIPPFSTRPDIEPH
jgi:Lrp/AsnC family transcriptional regulator for asnA, asnC and gidA